MFYTREGLLIATDYTGRKVISERDEIEYYEFEYKHLVNKNIKRKWKTKPRKAVNYILWESKEKTSIKIYEQKNPVNYADYEVDMFYINVEDLEIK